jgi:hypothetical protein
VPPQPHMLPGTAVDSPRISVLFRFDVAPPPPRFLFALVLSTRCPLERRSLPQAVIAALHLTDIPVSHVGARLPLT